MSHDVFLFLPSTIAPKVAALFTFAARVSLLKLKLCEGWKCGTSLPQRPNLNDRFKNDPHKDDNLADEL